MTPWPGSTATRTSSACSPTPAGRLPISLACAGWSTCSAIPRRPRPAIHVTGTNGKTSTARALTALLTAKGLRVGTFTSPHLERINERLAVNGEPISDADLAQVLTDLAGIEPLLGDGLRLTWFEILTGAALRWFADRPVDVAVFEVGLGGRWDATNVVDASVAVVTNVGLDHVEFLGPTRADVAGEKAGIVKPGATLVLGERDPDLRPIFERERPERLWWAGRDYDCSRNDLAVGGRVLDVRTPQRPTRTCGWICTAATRATTLPPPSSPPRPSSARRSTTGWSAKQPPPYAHPAGSRSWATIRWSCSTGPRTLKARSEPPPPWARNSPTRSLILVVGMLQGKDPEAMLRALGAGARPSGGGLPPAVAPGSARRRPGRGRPAPRGSGGGGGLGRRGPAGSLCRGRT